jgi:hypothetical protein
MRASTLQQRAAIRVLLEKLTEKKARCWIAGEPIPWIDWSRVLFESPLAKL